MADATIELELPAAHRYLSVLSACIGDLLAQAPHLAEPEVCTYNVQLAAQEICANIVNRAYDNDRGRIAVKLTLQSAPPRLVIDLHDHGAAFDPHAMTMPNQIQVRGYDLFLAQTLLDELSYQPGADGNHWRLIKDLEPIRFE